ncbi:MAG: hypothetical protein Q8L93_00290 [Rhodocyclaceae bacterium]|nr:hypothetical protein [Rhodocyclaceae bacterium]MDP1957627.1 hypothetical protein [Rhodocyclaceae bacterium]
MATMISEVYAAFRSAGVDEENARKAAEALSNDALATKADIARIERELLVIKWMLGVVVAATVIPLLKPLLG